MNYGEIVNDFLVEVRERGGFANDRDFDLIVGQVFFDKIKASIEEEREACAKLIDKQAEGMQVLINHAPTEIRREDLKRLKHSLNVAAACVRTRES